MAPTGTRAGENDLQLSKTISYALRHAPASFGLSLDPSGAVPLQALVASLRTHGNLGAVTEEDVRRVVDTSDKRRFAIEGDTIRAHYGHSTGKPISKAPLIPAGPLFHATTPSAIAAIRQDGLRPMKRQYVHLSPERDLALEAALRRTSQPILLVIDGPAAAASGVQFFEGHDRVTLAAFVPAALLSEAASV